MGVFVIGALLTIVAGVLVSNYLMDHQKHVEAETTPAASLAKSLGTQIAAKRRLWFAANTQSELVQQFQTWATTDLSDAELRTWMRGLTIDQVRALTEHLDTFCRSMGFELSWLTARRFVGNAQRQAAQTIIEHYCTACWQATLVQADFQRFKQVVDLLDQPFSREHKPVTQKLYADLVRRKLAPPITPELSVASEQARQAFVASSLKELAPSNWAVLEEAIHTLL